MDYKKDIIVYDFETPEKCFLASFLIRETGEWRDFLINKFQNDLYSLVKFIEENKGKWFCGYNVIKFDGQIMEYIWREHDKWVDKTSEEIALLISRFATEQIERSNYELYNTYRESDFSFKQLDLPSIWHFFNDNRRVSLKQLEFEMRAENIENLEFEMEQDFDNESIANMIVYCHNDITQTEKHLLFTIGEVEHKLYKGKDKIKDREIMMEEVGIPCINYDDVKIGAEWNKKDYMYRSGKDEKSLKPEKVNHFYGKKYKDFFPKTVKFQGAKLKEFIKELGNTFIINKKQEFKYTFNDELTVTIARGGIHSTEKNRYIRPDGFELYIQNDIGSQYPNALRKYQIFPKHLGKEWNEMLNEKIARRLHYKGLYKETKNPKYNSLQEMGKLSLNGGAYGRLGTPGDWQEDPCAMLKVTMGCQMEILMIVEALILKGFRVISANTDGWDAIVEKKRLDEYFEIVEYYEELIGNKEMGNVEFTVFQWIAQTSVNDYLARKLGEYVKREFKPHQSKEPGDWLKAKGDFEYWKELHKNSSFSILALAYQKYFDEGIDPEEFINNHQDIFDFCARSNSGSTYYHEGYAPKPFRLPKLIRYYVAKDGIHIKKIVKEGNDTGANDTNVTPAEELKKVCNKLPKEDYEMHLANVNRRWYIDKAKEIIYAVENGKKPNRVKVAENQISMF